MLWCIAGTYRIQVRGLDELQPIVVGVLVNLLKKLCLVHTQRCLIFPHQSQYFPLFNGQNISLRGSKYLNFKKKWNEILECGMPVFIGGVECHVGVLPE